MKGQTRNRPTFEDRIAAAKEQVRRIQQASPCDNDVAAVMMLAERGIPVDSIIPRVTVLPFDAWLAFGRHVRKGELSIAVPVWVPVTRRDDATGERVTATRPTKDGNGEEPVLRPVTAYLFHISQTDAYDRPHVDFWPLTAEMVAALRLCEPTPATFEVATGEPLALTAA